MDGYDSSTYGDRFADVYDDWYVDVTDAAACVAVVAELAGPGGRVLELGVGTGRLAIPLAQRGCSVTGLDSSAAMLSAMAAKPGGELVRGVMGDMAAPRDVLPDGAFDVVFVAFNTLFMLIEVGDQQRCLDAAASLLAPGGCLVVEAFVPDPGRASGMTTPRTIEADRVVLMVDRSVPEQQESFGQFIEITEAGIRLRPWHVRWSTIAQLDAMAADAGLVVADRWADWERTPFHADAPTHITRYVAS